jgi:hypothetical protein
VLLDASGPDEKLNMRRASNDLVARGKWEDGRWRVLMKRPLGAHAGAAEKPLAGDAATPSPATSTAVAAAAPGSPDLIFGKGQFIPVSFANWDGNNGEVGSKHTLTTWLWLLLPPDTNYALVYGMPFGTTIATFLAGIVLVRNQRRKQRDNATAGVTERSDEPG